MGAALRAQVETPIFAVPQAQPQTPAEAPVFRRRIRVLKAAKPAAQQSATTAKQADVDVPTANSCTEAAHKQYEVELKAAEQAKFIKERQQALLEQEAAKQAAAKKLAPRPKVRVMRCRGKPEGAAAAMPAEKIETSPKAEEPTMPQGESTFPFSLSAPTDMPWFLPTYKLPCSCVVL